MTVDDASPLSNKADNHVRPIDNVIYVGCKAVIVERPNMANPSDPQIQGRGSSCLLSQEIKNPPKASNAKIAQDENTRPFSTMLYPYMLVGLLVCAASNVTSLLRNSRMASRSWPTMLHAANTNHVRYITAPSRKTDMSVLTRLDLRIHTVIATPVADMRMRGPVK
jgi:hypothetical protein